MLARRILVPTDLSARSRAALRRASALAHALGSEMTVLYVIGAPTELRVAVDAYLGRELPAASDDAMAEARHKLDRFISSVDCQQVATTPVIEVGDPAATIVRVACELPADMIVMATHARTGIAELVLGSVTRQIVPCAPCPVMTLRGDEPRAHG
jgi:nucleotide-binding universal stress UspA family protein